MGWANIKESMEDAIKTSMQSDEFKDVVKKVIVETLDESVELIDKIVPNKPTDKEQFNVHEIDQEK